SNIAAAEYFIDTVGANGTGTLMSAVDGAFNSPLENVTASVDMSAQPPGDHTLYVHGRDAAANWGAAGSVVVTVTTGGGSAVQATITLIAGTLSGLAGGLHAPLIMVDPQMGLEVMPFVFMVVIIGGLGSIKGTLISAFLVGQVVSLGSLIYAPLAQMAPFAIMLLILLIKPTGLYGSKLLKR
ncbi:MAG: hypothetical protein AAB112_09040, partial [Thermodesulfobacteriota bacterium]